MRNGFVSIDFQRAIKHDNQSPASKLDIKRCKIQLSIILKLMGTFATKDDLNRFAMKEDLKEFATKEDLQLLLR